MESSTRRRVSSWEEWTALVHGERGTQETTLKGPEASELPQGAYTERRTGNSAQQWREAANGTTQSPSPWWSNKVPPKIEFQKHEQAPITEEEERVKLEWLKDRLCSEENEHSTRTGSQNQQDVSETPLGLILQVDEDNPSQDVWLDAKDMTWPSASGIAELCCAIDAGVKDLWLQDIDRDSEDEVIRGPTTPRLIRGGDIGSVEQRIPSAESLESDCQRILQNDWEIHLELTRLYEARDGRLRTSVEMKKGPPSQLGCLVFSIQRNARLVVSLLAGVRRVHGKQKSSELAALLVHHIFDPVNVPEVRLLELIAQLIHACQSRFLPEDVFWGTLRCVGAQIEPAHSLTACTGLKAVGSVLAMGKSCVPEKVVRVCQILDAASFEGPSARRFLFDCWLAPFFASVGNMELSAALSSLGRQEDPSNTEDDASQLVASVLQRQVPAPAEISCEALCALVCLHDDHLEILCEALEVFLEEVLRNDPALRFQEFSEHDASFLSKIVSLVPFVLQWRTERNEQGKAPRLWNAFYACDESLEDPPDLLAQRIVNRAMSLEMLLGRVQEALAREALLAGPTIMVAIEARTQEMKSLVQELGDMRGEALLLACFSRSVGEMTVHQQRVQNIIRELSVDLLHQRQSDDEADDNEAFVDAETHEQAPGPADQEGCDQSVIEECLIEMQTYPIHVIEKVYRRGRKSSHARRCTFLLDTQGNRCLVIDSVSPQGKATREEIPMSALKSARFGLAKFPPGESDGLSHGEAVSLGCCLNITLTNGSLVQLVCDSERSCLVWTLGLQVLCGDEQQLSVAEFVQKLETFEERRRSSVSSHSLQGTVPDLASSTPHDENSHTGSLSSY